VSPVTLKVNRHRFRNHVKCNCYNQQYYRCRFNDCSKTQKKSFLRRRKIRDFENTHFMKETSKLESKKLVYVLASCWYWHWLIIGRSTSWNLLNRSVKKAGLPGPSTFSHAAPEASSEYLFIHGPSAWIHESKYMTTRKSGFLVTWAGLGRCPRTHYPITIPPGIPPPPPIDVYLFYIFLHIYIHT
jgi:hypothetical protein